MPSPTLTYVLLCGLAIALVWTIVTDLRSRTISNNLTLSVALGAPLYWLSSGLALWPGVAAQLALALAVFAVCCALFALRQMGGGDVKLLTALALWVPPSQFTLLLVAMAMLGWVLTMAMAAWRIARFPASHAHPRRDVILLVVGTLVAAVFASAVLGGPDLPLPLALQRLATSSAAAALALALMPLIVLLGVTLGSIRIIRRHQANLAVPYGLAISLAAIWILGSGGIPGAPAIAAGG